MRWRDVLTAGFCAALGAYALCACGGARVLAVEESAHAPLLSSAELQARHAARERAETPLRLERRARLPEGLEGERPETRAQLDRFGSVRLTPSGPWLGGGGGKDASGRVLVAIQERGEQVQIVWRRGEVEMLLWLPHADLRPRLVREARLSTSPALDAEGADGVTLSGGLAVEVAAERDDALLIRYAVSEIRVAGWIPREAYGHVYTPAAQTNSYVQSASFRWTSAVYDAPHGGEPIARVGPKAFATITFAEELPGGDFHVDIPHDRRVRVQLEREDLRVQGWVDGAALRTNNSGGGRGVSCCGIGHRAARTAMIGPDVIQVPEGTRIYDRAGGEVVGVFRVSTWRRVEASVGGYVRVAQRTDWGEIPVWLRKSEVR